MIIPLKTRIMIVPDFGAGAGDEAMAALKAAIEAGGECVAKVVDLPALVRAEHDGEEIQEAKAIELSARKLEQLASCGKQTWDDDEYKWGEPQAIVVFGKSAMLAGGIGKKNVLFVNPEYDSQWPWKKQYYADIKLAGQYHSDKCGYERGFMETVLWMGTEHTCPWVYSRRYGLITNEDCIGEFWNRYPRMAEVNRDLEGDTVGLAQFICDFAEDELSFPLEEVYEAIANLPDRDAANFSEICSFAEPVKLNGLSSLGICFGAPMAIGQSEYKLQVAELDYALPIESVHTRRELNALRDAIVRAGGGHAKPDRRERVLIVPDYFTPYNSPNVKELYDCLKQMGYYVAVFVHGGNLGKSRQGLERRCKVKPFGLIVALETGCLAATRVANCPRIFVNPDWKAWEWMKQRLGADDKRHECRGLGNSGPFFSYILNREEVALARQMAERANIKRGAKPVYGWFTVDAVESNLPEEHLKRFNTCAHIPGLRLDTDDGISILAAQIDNILTIDNE